MDKYIKGLILLGIFAICSCKNDLSDKDEPQPGEETSTEMVLLVDTSTTYQTIAHFGASDAWSCQFVGNWPNPKKEGMAKLLFSKEYDGEGNPAGIGLSLWRFNIGAGSAEQGQESDIPDEWRRAESFMNSDGGYNWDKQAGQMWFAQTAKNMGVEKLLVFPNSPPVTMTLNGKAYANDGQTNLAPEQFDAFANYLATVIEGMQNKGLKVDYISPVNEPQWDWSAPSQEGTPFWNHEIAAITRALNQQLEGRGLTAQIDIAEAGQINYLYEKGDKAGRSEQIRDFYVPGSGNYVGDLSHLGKAISGHSYFTTSPFSAAVEKRTQLSAALKQVPDLKYWMSEYCILGDNDGEIKGEGRNLGIDPAIYIARVIHADLVVAQASAWHWWLAISPYDYKDGLIYIDHNKEDGQYYESKMLWALGNYSRFIRPGFQRIAMTLKDETATPGLLFSGYKESDTGELVFVLINSGIKDIQIRLQDQNKLVRGKQGYLTSSEKNLESHDLGDGDVLTVPTRSILTVLAQKPN
jgi:O-glycosyl hydrolase